jgi:hypothetical protein
MARSKSFADEQQRKDAGQMSQDLKERVSILETTLQDFIRSYRKYRWKHHYQSSFGISLRGRNRFA